MIKVIRKTRMEPTVKPFIISRKSLTRTAAENVQFAESIKSSITISFDALGAPSIETVDLGVQYDHRVTWLEFDLNNLQWNTPHASYIYKLVCIKPNGQSEVWEFDGASFEVPDTITKESGEHSFVLVIEEQFDDLEEGNIKIETVPLKERFISKPFKGVVEPSFYSPELDITLYQMETDQIASLTKPTITCNLADNGDFKIDTEFLGEKLDSFVNYLKFNPDKITAHLDDFTVAAMFKQGDKIYGSLFERTTEEDDKDDYDVNRPLISWIPKEVYRHPGEWEVLIFAFAGDLEAVNEEDLEEYYSFVSKTIKVKVAENLLKPEDLHKEVKRYTIQTFTTSDGQTFITSDDKYYIPGGNDNE